MHWFTSDWHLGHENTRKFSIRPYNTVEEMDKDIISHVFSKLRKGDNLYYLGDLTFSDEIAEPFLMQIKKRRINFYWILGNHDIKLKIKNLEQYCHEVTFQKVIKRDKTKIHLSHFPQLCWDNSFRNSFHMYGHIHVSSPEYKETERRMSGKSLNVNIELNNMKMWNLHEVFYYMENRPNNWDYEIFSKAKEEKNKKIPHNKE